MPPEAILQRPSVLQHVLALLRPADKASCLPTLALHFLLCFVCRIKQALGTALDPDLLPVPLGMCGNNCIQTSRADAVCGALADRLLSSLWTS